MARTSKRRRGPRLPQNVVAHRGKFRALVMVNGKRVASQAVTTPEEASELVRKIREAGELSQSGAPLTLATSMDLVRRKQASRLVRPGSVDFTEQKYRVLCRAWPESTYLHRIGAPQVQRYIEKRHQAGIASQTIRHEVSLLKRMFELGKRFTRGVLQSPFDSGLVDPPAARNKRFDHLTREQIETALQRIRATAAKEPAWSWQADVIEFLFLTGLRRAELARLRTDDVDPFKGTLRIAGKNEDEMRPLAEHTKTIAGRLVAAAGADGFLIPGTGETPTENGRANAITHLVARWKKRLGLKLHGSAHALRHSYCTALAQVPGVDFATLQRSMRHKTAAMTLRYVHQSGELMRNAAEAVVTGSLPAPKKAKRSRRSRAATAGESKAAAAM